MQRSLLRATFGLLRAPSASGSSDRAATEHHPIQESGSSRHIAFLEVARLPDPFFVAATRLSTLFRTQADTSPRSDDMSAAGESGALA